jgi:hypothetical protein
MYQTLYYRSVDLPRLTIQLVAVTIKKDEGRNAPHLESAAQFPSQP